MTKATANILKELTRTIKTSIINKAITINITIKVMDFTTSNNITLEAMDTMMNRENALTRFGVALLTCRQRILQRRREQPISTRGWLLRWSAAGLSR